MQKCLSVIIVSLALLFLSSNMIYYIVQWRMKIILI